MLCTAIAQTFNDSGIRYILPVLWMTSCFPVMGHTGELKISECGQYDSIMMAVCRNSKQCYLWLSSPGGGTSQWQHHAALLVSDNDVRSTAIGWWSIAGRVQSLLSCCCWQMESSTLSWLWP